MERNPTSRQQVQLAVCREFMERPSYQDVSADREIKPTVEMETFKTRGILSAIRAAQWMRNNGFAASLSNLYGQYSYVMQAVDCNLGIAGLPEIQVPECRLCGVSVNEAPLFQAQNGIAEGEYYCEAHFDCAGDDHEDHDEFFFAWTYAREFGARKPIPRPLREPKSNGLAHYSEGIPAYCCAGGPYFSF